MEAVQDCESSGAAADLLVMSRECREFLHSLLTTSKFRSRV